MNVVTVHAALNSPTPPKMACKNGDQRCSIPTRTAAMPIQSVMIAIPNGPVMKVDAVVANVIQDITCSYRLLLRTPVHARFVRASRRDHWPARGGAGEAPGRR